MIPFDVIDELTRRVSRSVDRLLVDIHQRLVETEPHMTDRLLSNIQRDFEETDPFPGVGITARTLRDRGRNAPENRYGADLATLLDADFGDYHLKKGFLAQAKWSDDPALHISTQYETTFQNGQFIVAPIMPENVNMMKTGTLVMPMSARDYNNMRRQCQSMLEISPDSFVFVYTREDVFVVSASAVNASARNQPFYCKNLKAFMTDYLTSFVGDTRIKGLMNDDFDQLKAEYNAKNILFFKLEQQ